MKYFVISFVALIMGLVLGLGFLYTEDKPDVDAQMGEYEWDVLPGVPIRYGALSSSIKITQEWHSAGVCLPLPSLHHDCSLDLGQVDGQPVHAVFRRSSGVDLLATFTLTSSDPKECRSVTAEIIETATGKTVATVYYLHVLMSISSGTQKNLSDLNIPASDAGKIGTIAVPHHNNYFLVKLTNDPDPDISQTYKNLQEIYKNKPSSQWDGEECPNSGPHLHQMVVPGSLGLVQQNRDESDSTKGISMDYTYISPHMWLWKIALTAPAITATKAPSEVHPSKLTVSTITIKRVGLPEASTGLGGTVKTNPVDGPYVAGEEVTLTAEENPGYIFARWDPNSDCSDLESSTCTITLPGADTLPTKTVIATFAPTTTLTTRTWIVGAPASGGGGDITPARGTQVYPLGKKVKVSVSTAPGYTFSNWDVDGGQGRCSPPGSEPPGLTRTCTVTLTADTTVTAYFWGPKGLTVPSSNEGSIKCTVGETTTNCEGSTTNYDHGTTVWLSATPDDDKTHEFSHWTVSTSGGVSGAADTRHTKNPLDVTLDADTTVTATFTAKATPTPEPSPTQPPPPPTQPPPPPTQPPPPPTEPPTPPTEPPPTPTQPPPTQPPPTQPPPPPTEPPTPPPPPTQPPPPATRTLTTSVSPSGGGLVSASTSAAAGQGDFLGGFRTWTFNDGATVYLRARPNQGYVFSQWGGNASGTSATTTIVMDGNKAATAIFALAPTPTPTPPPTPTPVAYWLTINTVHRPNAYGNVSPAKGIYLYRAGRSVTIRAMPILGGYASWSDCDRATATVCTVTMNRDRTVTATFYPATGFSEEEEAGDGASATPTATPTPSGTP